MSYCFRIRFQPGKRVHIASDATELVLATPDEHGAAVILRPPEAETTFNEANNLVLIGKPYSSAEAASEQAGRWLGAVQKAFARLNIGADFGDRATKGVVLEEGLRALSDLHERRVVNDVHGTMVFECDPWPMFAGVQVEAKVGRPAERVIEAVSAASKLGAVMSERERLAYNLYSASFSEPSADARFMMLMMSLETLIKPEPRSTEVIAHVDRLIADTRASDLPRHEVQSIVGTLGWVRQESIGQAGRRLAGALGHRRYMDEEPAAFFRECYTLRSALVHGHYPRPDRSEVDNRAAHLERFVSNLLSIELLDTVSD